LIVADFRAAIARCDAEQREILERADVLSGAVAAWLVALGLEDWEMEKRLIQAEFCGTVRASPRRDSLARFSARA